MSDEEMVAPQDPAPAEEPAPESPAPEPETPQYITPEQLEQMLEKREQRLQSWIGRRDADLIEKLRETRHQAAPDSDEMRQKMLEDPDGFFRKMQQRYQQEEASYMESVLRKAGSLMEQDPLFEDTGFGNEVVNEIKRIAPSIERGVNPVLAAKMLVQEAALAVERKRRATPKNPLDGNKPQKGIGSVAPPAGGGKKAAKPAIKSARAAEMAKKWGYSEEDLAKLFPG